MYTDDKNAQIVLALLKKYNIRKIVVSPGTTNVPIAGSVQADSFFQGYSVVDERSAAYFATGRVSEDGEFHQRYGNLRKLFDCSEYMFFTLFAGNKEAENKSKYYNDVVKSIGSLIIPDLPLSNTLISSQMASKLPENCSFHIGASESLSCMNFFEFKESIDSSCNVGALGIDGAVSSLVGQSMVDKNKLYFGQMGDLTFFYDMNVLGNRHIGNNLRLLLVNNGRGVRFRVSLSLPQSDALDEFTAAAGHYGSAEGWAKSMNFEYFSANNKDEFLTLIDDFCSPDINKFSKPVLFEVFTTVKDEQDALKFIRAANKPKSTIMLNKAENFAKKVLPEKAKKIIKILMEK